MEGLTTIDGHHCKKPIKFLDENEVEKIHNATRDILQNSGVAFVSKAALAIFKEAGCDINQKTNIVRIPEALVMESVKKAPESFILKARNPDYNIRIGGDEVHFTACPGKTYIDLVTGKRTPATLWDLVDYVRVKDGLEEVHSQLFNRQSQN